MAKKKTDGVWIHQIWNLKRTLHYSKKKGWMRLAEVITCSVSGLWHKTQLKVAHHLQWPTEIMADNNVFPGLETQKHRDVFVLFVYCWMTSGQ